MISKIYNEDCFETMKKLNNRIDIILTSPPYNMTKRKGGYADTGRYDVYNDWLEEDDYLDFTKELFCNFDKILKQNKLVLYNFSYSIENPSLPYKLVSHLEKNTPFTLADTIIWKKKSGLPFPANKRRLSRNWEFVFVFCRKTEIDTFDIYKPISSISEKTGQTYYNVFYNFVEAKNNDEKCPYNQATYSSDLCKQLLSIYAKADDTCYDPFIGSGTTAIACEELGLNCIGSELSEKQCEWAENRIKNYLFIKNKII